MDCLISVIMPVYGVEKWLEAAVGSVLNQTERRLELILVDDASPDGCPALCDALAARDERVRVIHKPQNEGLSRARNDGLGAARGEFIYFMDSDDAIDARLLETALAAIQAHEAELCVFGLTEEHYDAAGVLRMKKEIRPEARVCLSEEELRAAVMPLETQTLLGYAWNKLYRADFLRARDLRFQTVPLIEDILFNIDCVRDARRMVLLAECGYYYARRAEGSLTGGVLPHFYDMSARRLEALIVLHDGWGRTDAGVIGALAAIFVRDVLSALERHNDPRMDMNAKARRAWLKAVYESALYRRLAPGLNARFLPALLLKGRRTNMLLAGGRLLRVLHVRFEPLFIKLRAM